ncbi:sulfatase family protein [Zunongwangia pacifica]|uniref:Arylsulfatase n=1 Tax=Zunongwangia pacifica TaxID=2911062 RepID=A0A9X1ZTK0_9FLAO|nr:arylsulfatase [Zunongwangia pacifica]MCL6218980.1 arylsulfatase [Zunongwangia pacifica]
MKRGKMLQVRYTFIMAVLTVLLLPATSLNAQNTNKKKPNVVFIYVDDLGFGDIGAYGATKVQTPNIDKLASQGKRFTDAHTASAVCTPSRYALITGEYPVRANNLSSAIFDRDSLLINPNQFTLADLFKEQGYATGIVGKWHLGFGTKKPVNWNEELKPGPLELGFDSYFGVPVLNSHPPFVYVQDHKVVGLEEDDPFVWGEEANTRPYPEKWNRGDQKIGGADKAHSLYIDEKVGTTLKDSAVAFIKRHKEDPFFLYYATTNIHHPFTPAKRFLGESDAGRYGDFIAELDWLVGEVMNTLDEEGLRENTIVVLTSDNGGMLNRGGQDAFKMGHHMNGDLFGFKFDAWEGGHRIPFIIRWPGKVKANTVSDQLISSNLDMVATFASLFNRKLKKGEAVDSYNVMPIFLDETSKEIRNEMMIAPNDLRNMALRKGEWMYISAQGGGGFNAEYRGMHDFGGASATTFTNEKNSDIENGKIKADAAPAQLYNLKEDLRQTENLYNKYPEKVKEMKKELEKIKNSNQTRPAN